MIGAGNASATRALPGDRDTVVMARQQRGRGSSQSAKLRNITGITTQQEEVLGKLIGIFTRFDLRAAHRHRLDETNPTILNWSPPKTRAGLGLFRRRRQPPTRFGTA